MALGALTAITDDREAVVPDVHLALLIAAANGLVPRAALPRYFRIPEYQDED